ncbi:hypothetical protein [Pseudomonas oryzihabitans]|uniref:hypothetical protein n=1 Tax=Pseudomonas oryzihabitans TaxID=47885 RepID=UPI0011A1ED9D|nr:hypothetical protein [Pseudomonas oryzihabitans]
MSIRNNITTIIAALALALTILTGFVSCHTVGKLEQIDRRLDGITSELSTLKSPEYQQQVFNERMARLLDLVRQRQEIALAHSE